MKKRNIILLIVIAIIILIFVYYQVVNIQNQKKETQKFNSEFEQYTNSNTIYGTNIVTVINKAIDNNEKNKISKDEKGYYIEDTEKSIIIELNMINKDDEITVYKMEAISNFGIEKFLSSEFNLVLFECTDIQYHDNGRISKIVFTQTEK